MSLVYHRPSAAIVKVLEKLSKSTALLLVSPSWAYIAFAAADVASLNVAECGWL